MVTNILFQTSSGAGLDTWEDCQIASHTPLNAIKDNLLKLEATGTYRLFQMQDGEVKQYIFRVVRYEGYRVEDLPSFEPPRTQPGGRGRKVLGEGS